MIRSKEVGPKNNNVVGLEGRLAIDFNSFKTQGDEFRRRHRRCLLRLSKSKSNALVGVVWCDMDGLRYEGKMIKT